VFAASTTSVQCWKRHGKDLSCWFAFRLLHTSLKRAGIVLQSLCALRIFKPGGYSAISKHRIFSGAQLLPSWYQAHRFRPFVISCTCLVFRKTHVSWVQSTPVRRKERCVQPNAGQVSGTRTRASTRGNDMGMWQRRQPKATASTRGESVFPRHFS